MYRIALVLSGEGQRHSLSDVLKVKVASEAGEPRSKGDEELCERRMNVHEELLLDVFRREACLNWDCRMSVWVPVPGPSCRHRHEPGPHAPPKWTSSKTTLAGLSSLQRRTTDARRVTRRSSLNSPCPTTPSPPP